MKKYFIALFPFIMLSACGGQSQQDKQLAENQKQIEILKQQAEIQRLQNELNSNAASDAVGQVYQLAASEVNNTISAEQQAAAKSTGDVVQGNDGQQYMYDPDTGSWLLYGALGAAAGYLAANAMNQRNMAKYQPVQKPTAAVQRVYKDYQAKNPRTIQAPTPRANSAETKSANRPNYRPTQQGYSNTRATPRRSFGGRRR